MDGGARAGMLSIVYGEDGGFPNPELTTRER
jgi:hypothetical protein